VVATLAGEEESMSEPEESRRVIRITAELLGNASPTAIRTLVFIEGELFEVVGFEEPGVLLIVPIPVPPAADREEPGA
jgi:hypothetical protein